MAPPRRTSGKQRTGADAPSQEASGAPTVAPAVDVDALVARYAPIGRRLRRQRLLQRTAAVLVLPVLGIAGFQAWQAGDARLRAAVAASVGGPQAGSQAEDAARVEQALLEFRELKASVTSSVAAEIRALSAQRAELAKQRDRMEQQSALLARQLAAANGERAALAEQGRKFEAQGKQLADAIARVDGQRRQIEAQQARNGQGFASPELDRQLAEVARQRQALERQQQQFQDQSQLLGQELKRINAQRVEIERQRQAIDAQREELQGLLNQINQVGINTLRQRRHGRPDAAPEAVVAADKEPEVQGPLATLAAVDAQVLGEARGGVDMGEDFSVSIGITRSGSINGIEQFTNTMYLEDLGRANGAGVPQMDPVILQSGEGNLVSVDTLTGLSPNVTTIIQNTLDDQVISNKTVMDITLQNVSTVVQGLSNAAVVSESLSRQP